MKKILFLFFCLFTSTQIFSQYYKYIILGKGNQGQIPCSGTISVGNNKVMISMNNASHEWFVDDAKFINEKTVRYPIFGYNTYIEMQQCSVNEDVYFFVVPNFFEGQSGYIIYKTKDERAILIEQLRKNQH